MGTDLHRRLNKGIEIGEGAVGVIHSDTVSLLPTCIDGRRSRQCIDEGLTSRIHILSDGRQLTQVQIQRHHMKDIDLSPCLIAVRGLHVNIDRLTAGQGLAGQGGGMPIQLSGNSAGIGQIDRHLGHANEGTGVLGKELQSTHAYIAGHIENVTAGILRIGQDCGPDFLAAVLGKGNVIQLGHITGQIDICHIVYLEVEHIRIAGRAIAQIDDVVLGDGRNHLAHTLAVHGEGIHAPGIGLRGRTTARDGTIVYAYVQMHPGIIHTGPSVMGLDLQVQFQIGVAGRSTHHSLIVTVLVAGSTGLVDHICLAVQGAGFVVLIFDEDAAHTQVDYLNVDLQIVIDQCLQLGAPVTGDGIDPGVDTAGGAGLPTIPDFSGTEVLTGGVRSVVTIRRLIIAKIDLRHRTLHGSSQSGGHSGGGQSREVLVIHGVLVDRQSLGIVQIIGVHKDHVGHNYIVVRLVDPQISGILRPIPIIHQNLQLGIDHRSRHRSRQQEVRLSPDTASLSGESTGQTGGNNTHAAVSADVNAPGSCIGGRYGVLVKVIAVAADGHAAGCQRRGIIVHLHLEDTSVVAVDGQGVLTQRSIQSSDVQVEGRHILGQRIIRDRMLAPGRTRHSGRCAGQSGCQHQAAEVVGCHHLDIHNVGTTRDNDRIVDSVAGHSVLINLVAVLHVPHPEQLRLSIAVGVIDLDPVLPLHIGGIIADDHHKLNGVGLAIDRDVLPCVGLYIRGRPGQSNGAGYHGDSHVSVSNIGHLQQNLVQRCGIGIHRGGVDSLVAGTGHGGQFDLVIVVDLDDGQLQIHQMEYHLVLGSSHRAASQGDGGCHTDGHLVQILYGGQGDLRLALTSGGDGGILDAGQIHLGGQLIGHCGQIQVTDDQTVVCSIHLAGGEIQMIDVILILLCDLVVNNQRAVIVVGGHQLQGRVVVHPEDLQGVLGVVIGYAFAGPDRNVDPCLFIGHIHLDPLIPSVAILNDSSGILCQRQNGGHIASLHRHVKLIDASVNVGPVDGNTIIVGVVIHHLDGATLGVTIQQDAVSGTAIHLGSILVIIIELLQCGIQRQDINSPQGVVAHGTNHMEGIFLGIGLAIHILGLHKEGYIELFVEGLIIGVVGLHAGQVLQIHPVEITVSMINRILAGPVLLPLHFRADGSEPEVQIALITAHGHRVDRSAARIGIHGVIGHTVQRCQVSVHTHFHTLQAGG